MIRTLITVPVFIAALALAPALADHHEEQNEDMYLEEILKEMDLTMRKRNEVHDVMKQFREDRIKADKALQELSETLPPQEEVSATTVYSDIVLESRLNRVLNSQQVEQLMDHLEEQRRQRNEPQETDSE